MNMTLGTDPELMLYGKNEGRIVSALRVIGTDKHNPVLLDNGAKMYADNALCEASMPPEETVDGMINRLRDVFRQMTNRLGAGYSLAAEASAFYDKEEMKDEKLWEVGCNPNFDAYKRMQNIPIPFVDTMRTGSFHIHIGHEILAGKLEDNPNKERMVRLLDVYLGCASVIFDRDRTAKRRRKYYGKAGEFRPTPYGVEYRVLGNWSLRSPETTRLCFELAEYTLSSLINGKAESIIQRIGNIHPQAAINHHDKDVAMEVLKLGNTPEDLLSKICMKHINSNMEKAWRIYG